MSRNEPDGRSRFASVNGLRLHYLEWGTAGVPIVCLHGSSGNCHVWDSFARTCTHDHRVYALDQRGHGDSDKPASGYAARDFADDLDAFVEGLGLVPFVLVGLSLGSRAGTFYAGLRSEKLRALVLVDPSFDMSEAVQQEFIRGVSEQPESFGSYEELVAHQRARPLSRYRSDDVLREAAVVGTSRRPDGRLVWKYDRGAVIQGLRHARDDLWASAERIRVPTLLVRGAESRVTTKESAARMLETIPGSRLVDIDGAIHGIPQDNPVAFSAAVRAFLKEVL